MIGVQGVRAQNPCNHPNVHDVKYLVIKDHLNLLPHTTTSQHLLPPGQHSPPPQLQAQGAGLGGVKESILVSREGSHRYYNIKYLYIYHFSSPL